MKLPWNREDPEKVFERMLRNFLAGYEQGLGRPLTDAEKAQERARCLAGCSSWYRPKEQG
jgi:hypothetical protein